MKKPLLALISYLCAFHSLSAESFDDWLNRYFSHSERISGLANPFSDPDGDNQPTILEYFQGGDPKNSEIHNKPQLINHGGSMQYVFIKASYSEGLEGSIQILDHLQSWQNYTGILQNSPVNEGMSYWLTTPLSSSESQFYRLSISSIQGFVFDSDNDGLDDFFENEHFGNLSETAISDDEGDSLSSKVESLIGTNPTVSYETLTPSSSVHLIYTPN